MQTPPPCDKLKVPFHRTLSGFFVTQITQNSALVCKILKKICKFLPHFPKFMLKLCRFSL